MTSRRFGLRQRLAARLKAPLTTFGHGIHSPFLYQLVTEVWDPRYEFYRTAWLQERTPFADEAQKRAAWAVWRLAVYYSVAQIDASGDLSYTMARTIRQLREHPERAVSGSHSSATPNRMFICGKSFEGSLNEEHLLVLTQSSLRNACRVANRVDARTIVQLLPSLSLLWNNPALPRKIFVVS